MPRTTTPTAGKRQIPVTVLTAYLGAGRVATIVAKSPDQDRIIN